MPAPPFKILRRRALQRLGDPVPAARLVVHRPYELRTRRIRQFGENADQLTVELFWSVLIVLRSVRDKCDQGSVPTDQPRRDVPVVVKAYRSDVPGPDEFGPIVLSNPHVRRFHACLLFPLSHAGTRLTPAVGPVDLRRPARAQLPAKCTLPGACVELGFAPAVPGRDAPVCPDRLPT